MNSRSNRTKLVVMSEDKSRKALKLKTFDEIQNDSIYEIHFFPGKRRPPVKFCTRIPVSSRTTNEFKCDDQDLQRSVEDQVRTANHYSIV